MLQVLLILGIVDYLYRSVCICLYGVIHFVLQHVSDLNDIPNMADNHASLKQNTARTFAFKAHRCFHLAESYVIMKKWPEAIALFDRASSHVIQAIEQFRVLEHSGVEPTKIDKVCTLLLFTDRLPVTVYCTLSYILYMY